jgi:glycosyltransferase involved in cell wall biosynthesis
MDCAGSMPPLRTCVALATFNGATFLAEQLGSYLTQTRLPDELCISDDGSTDETAALISRFAQEAPFAVKVVSSPGRLGANKNFENVLAHCSGDVILFSDQDDVWLPHHVERLLAPMENDARIVVDLERSERFPSSLRKATMKLPRNQFELVLRHRIAAGHGMAFRANLIPLLVPFSSHAIYDQWVFLLAAAAGFVTYVGEPLTLHRQHARQAEANRIVSLRTWAANSESVTQDQQHSEEEKWRGILARVKEHQSLLQDARRATNSLEGKLNFICRRANARNASVPARLAFTLRELILGRYHRWGRGFLTFGRDLYGSRG